MFKGNNLSDKSKHATGGILQHGYQPTGIAKPVTEGYVPSGSSSGESNKDSVSSIPPSGGSVQQDD